MAKKALITGVTGQDGSYLAEFLLKKGYEVHGIVRRSSLFNRTRLELNYNEAEHGKFYLHYGDLIDSSNLNRILNKVQPNEIYNLAAQSHVGISFEVPEYTADVDALGTLRLLDAIRDVQVDCRFYQASTSEMFGKVQEIPQTETTPFYPRSPYGVAKLYSFWAVKNYREAYNMFACNGILFNHESPRRGENFVTRKITLSMAKILKGEMEYISLGNLDAKRDWGYAPEYVEAMWMMLQQDNPDDYVIATGETHTVREFVEEAWAAVGKEIVWEGAGSKEIGIDRESGKTILKINEKYYRPTEVDLLIGDAAKAKADFGWQPKTHFKDLVKIMMQAELEGAGVKLG